MARLRTAWPNCKIAWVINNEWSSLLLDNPDIASIIKFPRKQMHGVSGVVLFARWCAAHIYDTAPDLAIDFQGLMRSSLIGRFARARRLVGMSDAREGASVFYTQTIQEPRKPTHAVDRYITLADAMIEQTMVDHATYYDKPRFSLPFGIQPAGFGSAADNSYIVLHPYARGIHKSLNRGQVILFSEMLAPRRIVLVGRRVENEQICLPNVIDLLGETSLLELMWLLRHAHSVVSVDSGPAHLAAALGKPLVCIHTWSDPRRVGPYQAEAWIWKNRQLLQVKQLFDKPEQFYRTTFQHISKDDIATICSLITSASFPDA